MAAHGPTTTATSTPPRRCALVPAPSGKLNIWAANTNAVAAPRSGACRSFSWSRDRRAATARAVALSAAVPAMTGGLSRPSGM